LKRGTTRHPKLFALCEALHCRRPAAIGYLVLLWEFASEYAPQGDIGRYSEKRIEAAMDFRGTAGSLIQALLTSGWLDTLESPGGNCLVIHDWHDHCEESVRRKLQRHKLPFFVYQHDTDELTGIKKQPPSSQTEKNSLPLPLPLPLPLNTPPAPPNGGVPSRRLSKKEVQAERFREDQKRRKELERHVEPRQSP
jgi:hypothetical protein